MIRGENFKIMQGRKAFTMQNCKREKMLVSSEHCRATLPGHVSSRREPHHAAPPAELPRHSNVRKNLLGNYKN